MEPYTLPACPDNRRVFNSLVYPSTNQTKKAECLSLIEPFSTTHCPDVLTHPLKRQRSFLPYNPGRFVSWQEVPNKTNRNPRKLSYPKKRVSRCKIFDVPFSSSVYFPTNLKIRPILITAVDYTNWFKFALRVMSVPSVNLMFFQIGQSQKNAVIPYAEDNRIRWLSEVSIHQLLSAENMISQDTVIISRERIQS